MNYIPKLQTSYISGHDLFCGVGGGTAGAQQAGVEMIMASNHNELSVSSHKRNFPHVPHDVADLQNVHPGRYAPARLLIAGPDCTHHSRSRGERRRKQVQPDLFGQGIDPDAVRSRATMNTVLDFAEYHEYEVMIIENVPEVMRWARIDGWFVQLAALGYDWRVVSLNSMFGHLSPRSDITLSEVAPQSRNRIYIICWKKGLPAPDLDFRPLAFCPRCAEDVEAVQTFKNGRKWGEYKRQYHYACPMCLSRHYARGKAGIKKADLDAWEVFPLHYAAWNIIDFSLPSVRIGDREVHGLKPLRPTTTTRTQQGIDRWGNIWVQIDGDGKQPLLATTPIPAQMGGDAIMLPLIVKTSHTQAKNKPGQPATMVPLPTQTKRQDTAVAFPPSFIHSYYSREDATSSVVAPLPTVTGEPRHALVSAAPIIMSYNRSGAGFTGLWEKMSTVTTVPRHALLQHGNTPTIEDWYFRMLKPHELKLAQAFPHDYIVLGNERQQTAQIGQAMSVNVMKLLVSRVVAILQ